MKSFDELITLVRMEVNRELKRLPLPKNPAYLYDPIRYTINGNGKRFRPILVHLVGRANGIDPKSIMKISLAVELLHNFTLIHDDIMDNDDYRHGQEAIHIKWDTSTAILAGDGIYALAQILLSELSGPSDVICHYFNHIILEICEGQAMDKDFEDDLSINEKAYLNMIEKKTGSLLGACSAIPAIFMGKDESIINQLKYFGRIIGNGFQIHDDLLEIYGDSKDMGKSLGSDIFEGKQTLMAIKARNNYTSQWQQLIENKNSNNFLDDIRQFFLSTGIKSETEKIAESYFNSARETLKRIDSIKTDELLQFVNLIENRKY